MRQAFRQCLRYAVLLDVVPFSEAGVHPINGTGGALTGSVVMQPGQANIVLPERLG